MGVPTKSVALVWIGLVVACGANELRTTPPPVASAPDAASPSSSSPKDASVAETSEDAASIASEDTFEAASPATVEDAPADVKIIVVKPGKDPCAGGASTCADAGALKITCVKERAKPASVRYEPPYELCMPSSRFSKRLTDDKRKTQPDQCCYLMAVFPDMTTGTGGLI